MCVGLKFDIVIDVESVGVMASVPTNQITDIAVNDDNQCLERHGKATLHLDTGPQSTLTR